MWKSIVRILLFACLLAITTEQAAEAQFRRRGGFDRGGDRDRGGGPSRFGGSFRGFGRGGDSGRSDDERRRRIEEMRRRFGGFSRGRGSDDDERRRRIEEFRSRFGGGRGDDDDDRDGGDRSRYDRYRSRGGGDRSRGGREEPSHFVPKPHEPIGFEMPENYTAGDTDGDGQIALLEWRQWRPQEIAKFLQMDANEDGFLTPRELMIAENFPDELPATSSQPGQTYAAAQPTPTATRAAGRDDEGNRRDGNAGEKASAAEARYVFGVLDKAPKDGKLSSHEWSQSKSIRQGFEDNGISLPLPADLDVFLERYPPNRIVPQLRLPPGG